MAVRLVPIPEAAATLGMSITSVRRKLKTGHLRGQQTKTPQGHVWLVEVPDEPAKPVDGQGDGQAESHPTAADLVAREAVARLEAHNADLRAAMAPLEEELTARRREVEQLHTLLAQAQSLYRLRLPAPGGGVEVTPSADGDHAVWRGAADQRSEVEQAAGERQPHSLEPWRRVVAWLFAGRPRS